MALPTTITGLSADSDYTSQPFISSGGNVYVFGRDSTDTNLIRAFKATDPTSSFSNIGTDFDLTDSTHALNFLNAYQVSDVIHIVTKDTTGITSDLRYHTFNMATDAWVITNETIKNDIDTVDMAPSISVRSDGDVIVLYNGPQVANMGADRDRVYYARRESAVWTVDVAVDNGGATHWYAGGTVIGSSDRMHFFFQDGDADDAYQRTLTSANALQTFPSAFDTTIAAAGSAFLHLGGSYVSGANTKVRYPVYDATGSTINSAKLDSADAPTVTQDTDITGATNANTTSSYSSTFAADGTTLWHLFRNATDNNLFTQSNADDAGWSAPALFYDDATNISGSRGNIYTRGSDVVLAVTLHVGTTVKYHEYTITVGGSAWSSTAAASVTWSGKSTAASALNSAAVASVTWDGVAVAAATAADWSAAAVASVTWDSRALHNSAWSSTALASVTWDSRALHNSAWSSAAVASLTWNGVSTATSDLNAAAVATLTWNGTSTATSALSSTALASLTWNGASTATAALSSTAAASLTWNGLELTIASAAFSMDAVASLTWNGTSTAASSWSANSVASVTWNGTSIASSSLQSTALATLTWNATSTATSAFSSTALATLTWDGAEVLDAAWQSIAAASVTWDGASVATVNAAFSMAAAASLTWAGASVASSSWSSAAVATVTWDGVATAASAWNAAALASVTWDSAVGTVESGAFSSAAVASVTFNGISTAGGFIDTDIDAIATLRMAGVAVQAQTPADWNSIAAASATFSGGTTIPAAASFSASASLIFDATKKAANLDGWRRKRIQLEKFDEIEEADIIFFAAAYAYLEQNHGHY